MVILRITFHIVLCQLFVLVYCINQVKINFRNISGWRKIAFHTACGNIIKHWNVFFLKRKHVYIHHFLTSSHCAFAVSRKILLLLAYRLSAESKRSYAVYSTPHVKTRTCIATSQSEVHFPLCHVIFFTSFLHLLSSFCLPDTMLEYRESHNNNKNPCAPSRNLLNWRQCMYMKEIECNCKAIS